MFGPIPIRPAWPLDNGLLIDVRNGPSRPLTQVTLRPKSVTFCYLTDSSKESPAHHSRVSSRPNSKFASPAPPHYTSASHETCSAGQEKRDFRGPVQGNGRLSRLPAAV